MKTFAIMLLMLCSFSFLKAQTMVVETGDTVESFEVGEIKGINTFEKNFKKLTVNLLNIPVVLKETDNLINKIEKKDYLYSGYQKGGLITYIESDTVKIRVEDGIGGMHFIFLDYKTKSNGGGAGGFGVSVSIVINPYFNSFENFYFETGGSTGGCFDYYDNAKCWIYGRFRIILKDLSFNFDSNGNLIGSIKNKPITNQLKELYHKEFQDFPEKIIVEVESVRDDMNENSEISFIIE